MPRNDVNADNISLQSDTLGKNRIKRNNFIIPSIIFDLVIIGCLAGFAYTLRFTTVFSGFSSYFLCNDTDLSYPYYGGSGKPIPPVSTYLVVYVNDIYFYCLGALIPAVIVLFGELLYICLTPPSHKLITSCCDSCCFPLGLRRICRNVGLFWMSLLLMSIVTDSIKLLSGSKRPYFLNVPDIKSYIDDSQFPYCRIDISLDSELREASLSFPSYHATMASFAATYCVCYVQAMFDIHGSYFFRPIFAACLAGMALLAGYTQWMLYRCSWGDLIFGFILGVLSGIYICYGCVNNFREHQIDPDHDSGELSPLEEAKPAIFRWMSIPRLTMRVKAYPPRPTVTPYTEHSNLERNPGFQEELTRNMESRGRTPTEVNSQLSQHRQSTLY